MSDFVLVFGVIALVLIVTAIASGLVERSPLSFPVMFLGLGLALGGGGLGVIEIGPHNPLLEVVATLTLALVLFLDAIKLQVEELGKRWIVPALVLGPGTGLIIGLGAASLALLLGFSWLLAFIGGAVLASTDPVVLREIVRDGRIPRSVRQILKFEAGTNDAIVLPVILVLISVAGAHAGGALQWSAFLAKLLILGPAIGFAIGGIGSWMIAKVDASMTIRQEHQALYGIGMVLAAYAGATAAGGDGFLAAFAAGVAVAVLNQPLCDCFLDFGEIASEMAMLLAFLLFGAVLSGMLGSVAVGPTLILAGLVIFVIRPSMLGLVLARARMSWEAHAFVSWFGPRGLNSLLLGLLVVQANIPGSELLLATIGVVVLASTTVHGATATPLSAWYARRVTSETLVEERENTAVGLFGRGGGEVPRITAAELSGLLLGTNPPALLDVRSRSSYESDGAHIPGSIRVLPDQVIDWAADCLEHDLVVAYCS